MNWLDTIRSWWRDRDDAGPAPLAGAGQRRPRGRAQRKLPPEEMSHSSQQALSGYGSNPYDTYTWELHSADDGERRLKRATDVTRRPSAGDPTNPYDTGSFKGGWS